MTDRKKTPPSRARSPRSNGLWFSDEVYCALTRGLYMPPNRKTPARWPENNGDANQPQECRMETTRPESTNRPGRLSGWLRLFGLNPDTDR